MESHAENSRDSFALWLETKQLSQASIKDYLFYFDKLVLPFNQSNTDSLLGKYNNSISRAFVRNLKEFLLIYPSALACENVAMITLPKIKGRPKIRLPRILSEQEIHAIANAMTRERNALMLLLSFYTGLRLGGLIPIRPHDFRWKQWRENPTGPGELYLIEKGNKERIVLLPAWLMERLEKWIKEFASKSNPNPHAPLFQIGSRRWQYILSHASMKALGFHVNPHLLRHSSAMWLLSKGMPIEELKEFLGHTDITSTQYYIHLNKDKLRSTYSSIQDQSLR